MSEEIEVAAEEIAAHYSACVDSVALINAGKPADMEDADWTDTLARNKEHLTLMLAKDYWTTEDMAAIITATEWENSQCLKQEI